MKDVIERIGHQNPDLVKPALGPKEPWAYRNKMQMPVGGTKGDIQMGFYAMGSHDIVQGTNCPIQDEGNNIIAQACYQIAKEFDIEPYDEHTGKGILRHVNRSHWTIWMDDYPCNCYRLLTTPRKVGRKINRTNFLK